MTTTILSPGRLSGHRAPDCRGFTLVEVLISAALGGILMAAVLGAFLFMGRSQANAYHYVTMEDSARRGLEPFARDVRMASWAEWTNSTSVTLTVPRVSGGTELIEYYYDSTPDSPTYRCFLRKGFDPITGVNSTQTLIRDVQTFELEHWQLGSADTAANPFGTRQLQIRLTIGRKSVTAAAATNLLVSARYLLRNRSTLPFTP